MNATAGPLRQRQAQQIRRLVLEAVIAQLETQAPDDVSMAQIAQSAGISLRTLYRYFPDRTALLQAAGEHLYATLAVPVNVAAPEDIARSFLEAGQRLATRPRLVRALINTNAGRMARSSMRQRRAQSVRAALKPVVAGLDPGLSRRAAALIGNLCSATSWVSIADESGLSDTEAQVAVSWGIEALIDTLRSMPRPTRHRPAANRKVTQEE